MFYHSAIIMTQYIDKSALVAEIERRKYQFVSQAESFRKIGKEDKESYFAALASNMNSLSCFLDTLEVKELKDDRLFSELWKPADGNDLPEYEREVIALYQPGPLKLEKTEYCVSFAHRPNPKGWDGKSILTGMVEHYTPKTYGKGGWNIPDVKWWLDLDFPNES